MPHSPSNCKRGVQYGGCLAVGARFRGIVVAVELVIVRFRLEAIALELGRWMV